MEKKLGMNRRGWCDWTCDQSTPVWKIEDKNELTNDWAKVMWRQLMIIKRWAIIEKREFVDR